MAKKPKELTHRSLGASCFNSTWDYLDKPQMEPDEIEEMIHVAHASFWHWTQVEDHTPTNISVGSWQLSRVYAVANLPERAMYFAERCIHVSEENDIPPFYTAYAYEAMARAKELAGDSEAARDNVDKAKMFAEEVEEKEDQKAVLDDLDSIL